LPILSYAVFKYLTEQEDELNAGALFIESRPNLVLIGGNQDKFFMRARSS